MASAKYNVDFVPEKAALPSFWLSIVTLLEFRERKIKNAYCSLYTLSEKASRSDSEGNLSLVMMEGPGPTGS